MQLLIILILLQLHVSNPTEIATPEEIKMIMERHNFWRNEVGVAPMSWDDELARDADKWANELRKNDCGFFHSKMGHGENLWKGTAGFYTVSDAVDSWGSEKEDYNYNKNRCKPGKVCGHYTQIVWANTTRVGCARVSCDDWIIWVCEYDPPGNYIGEKPY